MKFSKMPYQRIDLDSAKEQFIGFTKKLKAAASFDEAKAVFGEVQKLDSGIQTASNLANIRHTIDTQDSFYDAEKAFYDEAEPVLQELQLDFVKAMLESPFRSDFEKEFGVLYFKNAEINLRTFDSAIIPDLQEENRVASEYVKLVASAQIEFEGEMLTLSQLQPHMQSKDREKRIAAWNAYGGFYKDNGAEFDRIYDQLVKIRTKIGRALGHESFIPTGYDRMVRNSYTVADVEKFRAAVVKYIVPIVARLKEEQAKRTGASYPMTFPDDEMKFRGGNANPFGTPDEIMVHGIKMYRELSTETAEFIDFMTENELFDVLSRKGKASGGYCTSLPDYRSPFIFANFNGTSHDVEVITHEAGHAFAGYQARDIFPSENRHPTHESCEIHSMAMEFFAWPWCEGFFGDATQKFYYQHLAGALTFIPYGTMVDHFQHEMYANPDLTPDERHHVWARLEKIYRPWIKDEETVFYKDGRNWQRQLHIYEIPFYYIDYCLAQTVALQFWAAIGKDRADAWNRYLKLVSLAGTKTFDELVAAADMASPFGDMALAEISAAAGKWLDEFDRSALD